MLMIPGKKRKAEEPKEDLTLSKTGRPEMTRVCTPAGPVAMAMVQTTLTRSPKKQQPAPEPANPPPVQPRAGQTLFTTHPNPPLVQPGQTLFTTHPKPPGPFLAAGLACVLPQIQPFRSQESSETLQAYVTARTKHFRARPPLILALIESYFPAIVRNPKFAIELDGPHKAAVTERNCSPIGELGPNDTSGH